MYTRCCLLVVALAFAVVAAAAAVLVLFSTSYLIFLLRQPCLPKLLVLNPLTLRVSGISLEPLRAGTR